MAEVLKWIGNNIGDILAWWGAICIFVDFIVGWTKTDKDNAIWTKVKNAIISVINILPKKK